MVIMGPFSVDIVCLAAVASSLQVMAWLSWDHFLLTLSAWQQLHGCKRMHFLLALSAWQQLPAVSR
jgi:hypothetical protein